MENVLKIINTICLIIISLSMLYIAMNVPDLLDRLFTIANFIGNKN